MPAPYTFRPLTQADCTPALLQAFRRDQQVTQSFRKRNGGWVLEDTPFFEQWDATKKQHITGALLACLGEGGGVAACFAGTRCVGWAAVLARRFGTRQQYVNLSLLHVSSECRGQGLGRQLFERAKAIAASLGAQKLYISAHAAKETQAFYRRMGCREAAEIDPGLFAKEPDDCHLECTL